MRLISPLLLIAALFLSLAATSACAPSQPSPELAELEQLLQTQEAQQLREVPNAIRYHEDARRYRRAAEEARQDRRDDASREYAILGLLRYRTAVAVVRQFEAAERLQEANAQIQEINPQLRDISQSRNDLAREIRELDEELRRASREREEQRRQEMAEARRGSDDGHQQATDAATRELIQEINDEIARAIELRERALEFHANEYDRTRGVFDRAATQLENARNLLQSQPSAAENIHRQVQFAVQLFEEAVELSEPIHTAEVERMRPANRVASLRQDARNNLGRPFAEDEHNGARLILARLFPRGEGSFQRNTEAQLDVLKNLAMEYEEFSIQIIGFTQSRGGATQNLATSQLRAQNVRDLLIEAGVDHSRITTEGRGQDNIRYSDNADNNDRVEVIFRHSNP